MTDGGFYAVLAFRSAESYNCPVMDESRLRKLLEPFAFDPTEAQSRQTLAYLELLLKWNEKINLTAIRNEKEVVTRHFGESLLAAKHFELRGRLLDIGTGAGFPGLALKIAFPELAVTLLEPVAKKRAFLKEAARVCGFEQVEVRGERLEDIAEQSAGQFDTATMRAVGNLESLVPLAARCVKPGGQVLLWLTAEQALDLEGFDSGLTWAEPLIIPLSRSTQIWRGHKSGEKGRPS